MRFGKDLRFMIADPNQLRGGKAGQGRIAGHLDEPVVANPLGDLSASAWHRWSHQMIEGRKTL